MDKKELSSTTEPASSGRKQESRRKFLKGAAATTPVLLTIASRPVWARNCTLSGQLSGNLSNQDDEPCSGEGCTPGYWHNRGSSIGAWSKLFPEDMPFVEAFQRDAFPGKTLYEVVNPEDRLGADDMNLPQNCSISYFEGGKKSDSDDDHKHKRPCVNALRQLGFHAVAALQNAATAVKYDLNVETVIASFQASYDTGTQGSMEDTKSAFAKLNEQHCPF